MIYYQDTYCNCTEKYELAPWCQRSSLFIREPFCVLNGGLQSIYCQGARRMMLDGRIVDDYTSSHQSICSKSVRKLYMFFTRHCKVIDVSEHTLTNKFCSDIINMEKHCQNAKENTIM